MVAATATFSGPQYYDECLGPAWFGAYAVDLVRRLPQHIPGDVLEIACGTGLVTQPLRAHLHESRRLIATDLSKTMLDYARHKLRDHRGIEWHEADALNLPFENGSFGAVVCGFGVMFVPDRVAALNEARRVLVDGGILLFNVWDRLENNPAAAVNAAVLESLFPGDVEMRFSAPFEMYDFDLLRGLLERTRFREIKIEVARVAVRGADPRVIATGQIRGTPRSVIIEKRGVSLEDVVDKVAGMLEKSGGNPYNGYTQAVVVEASAI